MQKVGEDDEDDVDDDCWKRVDNVVVALIFCDKVKIIHLTWVGKGGGGEVF